MGVGSTGPDLTDQIRKRDSSRGARQAEIWVTSHLEAPPEVVWDRITTQDGVNDEMRPFLRMRFPAGTEGLDPDSIELGRPVGRCWLLLFGLVPFDYDDLTLVRLEPGRGFLERSRMLSQQLWEHQRALEPSGSGGCLITDRVLWQPRLGLPGAPLRPLIRWFFRHRHKRLRRRFGGRPG
jgi:ligand-binding SRPBCC domain-containing protein